MDLTDLTLNLQAARKLRPLLQGITGLLAVADQIERHQHELTVLEDQKAKVIAATDELRARYDEFRQGGERCLAEAKAEAAKLIADGLAQKERLAREGQWELNRAQAETAERRTELARQFEAAEAATALLRLEASKVAAEVDDRKKELASVTQAIADARELMRRFGQTAG